MMNRRNNSFQRSTSTWLLAGGLFLHLSGHAQMSSYAYKRPIEVPGNDGYYRIVLPPEIQSKSKSNDNDLRVYSISGKDTVEIPYLYEHLGDHSDEVELNFERINDSYNEKCCSYVTLKFEEKKVINTIRLEVGELNFDKTVMIEGSNDNRSWVTVADHQRIVNFHDAGENFSHTELQIPPSEYSYFRLKFDDDGSKRITVYEVSAYLYKDIPGNYHEVPIKKSEQDENKKEHQSSLFIDLGFQQQLDFLELHSSEKENYFRNVDVYQQIGTINGKEQWQLVASDVVSSRSENKIRLFSCRTSKLKVIVDNYDNAALQFDRIKVLSEDQALTAKLKKGANLFLCYGKDADAAPVYDLVHFKDEIPQSLNMLQVGAEIAQVQASIPPANALIQNKKWLWVVMALLIALIGFFSLRMMRKG